MGGLFYQSEANHIVDYQLWRLDGSDEFFRGPQTVLRPGKFVAYVGAAQTFGTFCRYPFPNLIGERVGQATANLGVGGAGAGRFIHDRRLMSLINDASVAVIQVMSGRSAPNSRYENLQGTSSLRPRDNPKAPWVWAEAVWEQLFHELPHEELAMLVQETRDNWLAEMKTLLNSVRVPKILLWISPRTPNHEFSFDSSKALLGPFPHFVNQPMLEELLPLADSFVSVVSKRGLPQRLYDRYTGDQTNLNRPNGLVTLNHDYPSPEMHVDAAEQLTPVIQELSQKTRRK
jgi:hypothetical protein